MFVATVTRLPTAAKVSPVLEGLFNGLLAWAFMFAGFLSDERSGTGPYGSRDPRYYERMVENQEQVLDNGVVLVPPVSIAKKNLIGLVPTIIGMQFLMSAFFLPYLFTRTSERSGGVRPSDEGRGGRHYMSGWYLSPTLKRVYSYLPPKEGKMLSYLPPE